MAKIKLPWHTCSRVVEMYGDMAELEAPPSNSLETLRRINETTKETTPRPGSESKWSRPGETNEARESTSNAVAASGQGYYAR